MDLEAMAEGISSRSPSPQSGLPTGRSRGMAGWSVDVRSREAARFPAAADEGD
jgi:hypothetical protein